MKIIRARCGFFSSFHLGAMPVILAISFIQVYETVMSFQD